MLALVFASLCIGFQDIDDDMIKYGKNKAKYLIKNKTLKLEGSINRLTEQIRKAKRDEKVMLTKERRSLRDLLKVYQRLDNAWTMTSLTINDESKIGMFGVINNDKMHIEKIVDDKNAIIGQSFSQHVGVTINSVGRIVSKSGLFFAVKNFDFTNQQYKADFKELGGKFIYSIVETKAFSLAAGGSRTLFVLERMPDDILNKIYKAIHDKGLTVLDPEGNIIEFK